MDDVEHGKELAGRFLALCVKEDATGVALLNAMGSALVGFFMTHHFDNHGDRMTEARKWCKSLQDEIEKQHRNSLS